MNEGWIKVSRHILNNPLWLSEKFTEGQAWLDLLLLANHKKGSIRVRGIHIDIERGQCGYSMVELAKRWKWSRGKVKRFLNYLERQNSIELIQQNNCVSTIISITNYEIYQSSSTAETTFNMTANGQQTDTNKNVKNKRKYNTNISTDFELFREKYPGPKRGLETELGNFLKKNDPKIIPLLNPALEREIQYHEWLKSNERFESAWKHLSTWVNKKCWEQVWPEPQNPNNQAQKVEIEQKQANSEECDIDKINRERLKK